MSASAEELIIVGAGPAGLCAAAAARARGVEALVLEAQPEVGGLWRHVPPDMRCLSPRQRDRLPDGSYPQGLGVRATAAEVLAAVERYAARARFRIEHGARVSGIARTGGGFELETPVGSVSAARVLVATGEFGRPRVPDWPGEHGGIVEHSSALRLASVRPGERIAVVGGGNSAAVVVPRLLDRGAQVTLSLRAPLQRPVGVPPTGWRGELLWRLSGLRLRHFPGSLGCRDQTPLVDSQLADAVAGGQVRVVGEARGYAEGALLAGEAEVLCDRVVLATGFRRDTAWLSGLLRLTEDGRPEQREGLSTTQPGIAFLGLPCMRTRRSGFLRGFAEDACAVVDRLL